MGHIHGVSRDPETGDVLLATHGGLFRIGEGGPTTVGPEVDFMGFAVAPDGSYLGSGHPGTGVDLPNPVGLIQSTDSGATWTAVSRAGESDFHGLSAGTGLVAGFDGALRISVDGGATWQTRDVPAQPHILAVAPSGGQILATTEAGLLSSTDAGATWTTLATPALLLAVSWADDQTVAGVDTSGRFVLSSDAGATWTQGKASAGQVTSLHATTTSDGVEIVAIVDGTVVSTRDLGESLERLL